MREQDLLLLGLITVCTVSTIALVRLIAVLRVFKRQRDYTALSISGTGSGTGSGNTNGLSHGSAAVDSSRILLPSLVFHVLVFFCLATEVPVYAYRYAATLQDGVGVARPLYALHLCSYLLLFSAFCVIVTLWGDVAVFEPNEWTMLMNSLSWLLPSKMVVLSPFSAANFIEYDGFNYREMSMLVLCLCYLLVTVAAVSVCLGVGNVDYFFSSFAFLLFCAYSIAALLLLGTCFLVLGCLLQRRICRVLVTVSCTPRLTARVLRLNVVMLACFICFTLRALMLACLVEVQTEGELERHFERGWNQWEWDMRLEWAPHIIPCVAMLYLMRNAGEPSMDDSGEVGENTAFIEGGRELSESGDIESHDKEARDSHLGDYGGTDSAPQSI